jgi:abortive infection bacteriophage resistance protein
MKYSKPPLSLDQQVDLLQSRGLAIPDRNEAVHHLKNTGYYRLSGYALPFQDKASLPAHVFKAGTIFNDVLKIYRFDCDLRAITMSAIEKIEVAFRTYFSNVMSERHGAFWYLKKDVFHDDFHFYDFIEKVQENTGAVPKGALTAKGSDVFLKHYFSTYSEPALPPSWMIVEVLSFSTWSSIYPFLKHRSDKKAIADLFELPWETLASWVHAAAYVRNFCAHHSRLWNREFTITPSFANHPKFGVTDNTRFFAQATALSYFMKKISPNLHWGQRVGDLIKSYSNIDPQALGFPRWVSRAMWFYEI